MTTGWYLGPLYFVWSDLGLSLLLLALVIPLGWLYGRRLARQGLNLDSAFQSGSRAWLVLAGFLFFCSSLALVYRLPHLLSPGLLAILEPAAWLAAKSGAVFLAAMALPLGQGRQREVLSAVALGGFCVLAVLALQGWFDRPIDSRKIFVRKAPDGSILQSTSVTCTAAAFANALQLYEIQTTEQESARILGTRETGTTQLQLLQGARTYGLFANYVSILPEYLVRMNRPALVSIDLRPVSHSILVYGHDAQGNLLTLDPLSGKGKLSPQKLKSLLQTAYGVVLSTQPLPVIQADSPRFLIQQLQRFLHKEAYLKELSGSFDQETQSALKDFQRHWKLPVTGQLDAQTWLLLSGPDEPLRQFQPQPARQES